MSDSILDTKLRIANLAWKPLRSRANIIYEQQYKKTKNDIWMYDNHCFIKERWMGKNLLSCMYTLPEEFQEETRKLVLDCIAFDEQVRKVTQQVTPLLLLLTENKVQRLPINILANLDLESVRAMLLPGESEQKLLHAMKQYELAKPELQKYIAYQLLG